MADDIPPLDKECFFIAPIGKEGSSERNRSDGILEFIVARAAQELELTAVRADQIGEPGQITLQVIDHILGAKAAVADLTGLNPNVFYELAVRHTARLPVALIAEKGCQLPFDIAQMRTIFFDHTDLRSADQCRGSIVIQLREALTKGAVDSPIATSIDVRALQGGTAVERNLAELVTTVEGLARTQRQDSRWVQRLYMELSRSRNSSPRAANSILRRMANLDELLIKTKDEELYAAFHELEENVRYLLARNDWIPPEIRRGTSPVAPPRTAVDVDSPPAEGSQQAAEEAEQAAQQAAEDDDEETSTA
jgi:hypothetical protein